jgi:hypothetical protein
MNTIEQITKYKLNGQEYPSLKAVKNAVECQLGSIIDVMSQRLTIPLSSKQKIELFDQLVQNKAKLINALSVEFDCNEPHDHTVNPYMVNILDYKGV